MARLAQKTGYETKEIKKMDQIQNEHQIFFPDLR